MAKPTKQPKHAVRAGSWIPAKKGGGYTVVGQITKRLIEKMTGWDNPGR